MEHGTKTETRTMRGFLPLCLAAALATAFADAAVAQQAAWQNCAEGIEYRMSSEVPRQGSIVLLEVRGAASHSVVEGRWDSQSLPFWRVGERLHHALIGVDLDRRPGASRLRLTATQPDGRMQTCELKLQVQAGIFLVERLRVEPQFVEPPPEVQPRIVEESRLLRELFRRFTPQRLWQGTFVAPLEGIQPAGNFGRRRIFNRQPRPPHTGEDFPAPSGTPVRATQRGRVVLARELYFAGNTVILDHGLGLYTFYAHLSRIATQEGTIAEKGQIIGEVGATGRVTGAHLHWAARLNNARVDPLDLLRLPAPEPSANSVR